MYILYFLKMHPNFDNWYQIKPKGSDIFMTVFIDLWPCLFTTKLSYAHLFKWGHSISTSTYSVIQLYLVGAFYSSAIHCSSTYFKWGTAIFQIKHINIHIPDIVMCSESKLVTCSAPKSHLTNRIWQRILPSIIKKPDWNQESYYLSNLGS